MSRKAVFAALPPPPARVLEVGAGTGELAAALREGGYEVLAVDPAGAGAGAGVVAVALLDVQAEPASVDAAIAVLSLHHVRPLEASLARLAELVRPGGVLVVDEFDVEAFDERAAGWLLERATPHQHQKEPSTLVAELRAHLHAVARIREALAPHFLLTEPERVAYLNRWDLPPGYREDEERLIAAGALPATGVRFTGTRR